MNKPRIFLGSSGKQAKLLQAITRGLEDVADVEPWTTTFNPGRSTLDRLVELSQEVDFAAFVFAQDDWTTTDASQPGQASPRDNVVFEAGLFGGALGIRRTFILHANGSKLPSDLLGLTSVRYDPATSPAEVRAINQKVPALWLPSLDERALRERLRQRMHLVRLRTSAKARIAGLQTQWGVRVSLARLRRTDGLTLLERAGVPEVWRRSVSKCLALIEF